MLVRPRAHIGSHRYTNPARTYQGGASRRSAAEGEPDVVDEVRWGEVSPGVLRGEPLSSAAALASWPAIMGHASLQLVSRTVRTVTFPEKLAEGTASPV